MVSIENVIPLNLTTENLIHKMWYLLEKTLVLCIICSKCKNEHEKLFKEEESIEILKILGIIENIQLL